MHARFQYKSLLWQPPISNVCPPTTLHRTSQRLLYYHDVVTDSKAGYTVTYDNRSFMINGTRTLLLSGSVHYPRSTPAMWDGILQEMVKDGLNMVEIYIFWNLHEFKQGQAYNFKGNANWMMFVEKAAAAGLFVNLRIGPYVCAEWNYGEREVCVCVCVHVCMRACVCACMRVWCMCVCLCVAIPDVLDDHLQALLIR